MIKYLHISIISAFLMVGIGMLYTSFLEIVAYLVIVIGYISFARLNIWKTIDKELKQK